MLNIQVAIIGPGLVGKAFLAQLAGLQKRTTLSLRLVAVASTKLMALSSDIDPHKFMKQMTTPFNINEMITHLESFSIVESSATILIDATSSQEIAEMYPSFLSKSRLHIITPNKKPFSLHQNLFDDILAQSRKASRFVLHESSVGAGLPVLSTLSDMCLNGDEFISIEGVLSGTFSFIFNHFSSPALQPKPKTFSHIVGEAQKLGYTEPDPRDDLNGMDVARKVVILARCTGVEIELADLKIQNLIPETFVSDLKDFIPNLANLDSHFESLNSKAKEIGSVLRYVGGYDFVSKKAYSKLENFAMDHPFASLKGSDNMICIYSRLFPNGIVIQGSGAGAEVTAHGMMCDLLRICKSLAGGPLFNK